MPKAFGLIVPPGKTPIKPTPTANFARPSIFGESDSDEDAIPKAITKGPGLNQKRQAKKIQAKALEQDPTIFQYDELYDEMEQQRNEIKSAKSNEIKKPKYIGKLLETAEKRKKEQERRIERQVQKEREAEGEMFKDKESFVTSAYRAKLEEMRLAEEEEKREAYLESIGDVTKQKDLGGFYRHLYEQRMAAADDTADNSDDEKPEPKSIKVVEKAKERSYRKRKSSQDEKEEAEEETRQAEEAKKAHIQSNLDADSDFSIDSSSDEEGDENGEKQRPDLLKNDAVPVEVNEPENKLEPIASSTETKAENPDNDDKSTGDEDDEIKTKEEKVEKPPVEQKPKIDIWKKRTVGEVYEDAIARYYERKALRESERAY